MFVCKRCGSDKPVKNGKVRGQQRYRCQQDGGNGIAGDRRVQEALAVKRASAVILFSLGKASFDMLEYICEVSRALTVRWINAEAATLAEPTLPGDLPRVQTFPHRWTHHGVPGASTGKFTVSAACRSPVTVQPGTRGCAGRSPPITAAVR